jgi:hypothetical protein
MRSDTKSLLPNPVTEIPLSMLYLFMIASDNVVVAIMIAKAIKSVFTWAFIYSFQKN